MKPHRTASHLILPLVLLALALGALGGCQEQIEDPGVGALVDDLSQALEDRDVRGLLRHTTPDFLLFPGRVDRRAATRRAFLMFKLHGPVEALFPRPEVELDGEDAARVSGPFLIVRRGAPHDPALIDLEHDPEAWAERAAELGEVSHADLSLVRRGDSWLVQTARFF